MNFKRNGRNLKKSKKLKCKRKFRNPHRGELVNMLSLMEKKDRKSNSRRREREKERKVTSRESK